MTRKFVRAKSFKDYQILKTKPSFVDSVESIGKMRVIVHNDLYKHRQRYSFEIPKFKTYEGTETTLKHVDNEHFLCLTTGIKDFPVRVIERSHIVSIDNARVKQPKLASVKLTKIVKGSKGDEYVVTKENGKWSCTCTGFQFRRKCKHVG